MKKIVLTVLLICLAVSVFAQNALIREISGTVELKNAGASAFVAAKAGDRVAEDTIISTSLRSTALLEVGSTVITVRPLTRLSLTEIRASQGNETLNVNLQAGRVRVDVNPPAGLKTSMAVTAPGATASVRGTSFEFDTRNISVSDGIVYFKGSRGYTFQVGAGATGSVGARHNAFASHNNSGVQPQGPVGYDGRSGTTGAGGTDGGQGNTPGGNNPGGGTNPSGPFGPPARPDYPSDSGEGSNGGGGSGGSGDIGVEYN